MRSLALLREAACAWCGRQSTAVQGAPGSWASRRSVGGTAAEETLGRQQSRDRVYEAAQGHAILSRAERSACTIVVHHSDGAELLCLSWPHANDVTTT